METPGEYGSLGEYFRHYRSPQQTTVPRPLSVPTPISTEDLPSMAVSYVSSVVSACICNVFMHCSVYYMYVSKDIHTV